MNAPLLLACALALSGCASAGDYAAARVPDSGSITNAIGARFAGRPVAEMVARYGIPVSQMPLNGETLYGWEASDTVYFDRLPPAHVTCRLTAYVQADGIVRTMGLSGQQGACPRFIP